MSAGGPVSLRPCGAVVSAGNSPGWHLSARERILVFPVIGDAEWVVVDRTRPNMYDRLDPVGFTAALDSLRTRPDFSPVYDRDGVMVFRRTSPVAP